MADNIISGTDLDDSHLLQTQPDLESATPETSASISYVHVEQQIVSSNDAETSRKASG